MKKILFVFGTLLIIFISFLFFNGYLGDEKGIYELVEVEVKDPLYIYINSNETEEVDVSRMQKVFEKSSTYYIDKVTTRGVPLISIFKDSHPSKPDFLSSRIGIILKNNTVNPNYEWFYKEEINGKVVDNYFVCDVKWDVKSLKCNCDGFKFSFLKIRNYNWLTEK